MRRTYLAIAFGAVLTACSFDAPISGGGDADVPVTRTVEFETATTQADERVGTIGVEVVLSEAAATAVTVAYEIGGGSATPGTDFQPISASTVTFAPGETRQPIEVAIVEDNQPEDDETIELVLASAVGANLGRKTHEIRIAANALPRVQFSEVMSSADEPTDATLEVTLTEMSSFAISVDYVVGGTATSGTDYVLAAGTLAFPPNTLTQTIPIDVAQDALDEADETVIVTLQTAQNAVIDDAARTWTHKILDEDLEPNIAFAAAAATVGEDAGTVNVMVQLSAVSGRDVSIPFALDAGSSATGTADFTIGTTSPITIPAGQTSAAIAVTIVNDTVNEAGETIVIDLETSDTAIEVPPLTHTLTIADDDLVCFGPPNSASSVCFDDAPQGAETLPASINTTNSPLCAATQPVGWTAAQDPACVIARDTITVSSNVVVTGTRPLVLVAASTLTINATLDAASHVGGTIGAASPSPSCAAAATNPEGGGGAGGGAGASFMTLGGAGATGDQGDKDGGTPAAAESAAPAKLRAGCNGQRGGNDGGSSSGAVGRGGGAVYLVSGNTIAFGNSGGVNVSGAGAGASNTGAGGTGGGSGGMLDIYAATTLTVGNATKLVANGGGGGSGGAVTTGGSAGQDPSPIAHTSPAVGGSGNNGAGSGGDGFAGTTAATAGTPGTGDGDGGGGGGGGGGFIRSNLSLGNADVSAGLVTAP